MVDDKLRWFDKGGRRIDRTTNDLLSAASPTDVRIRNRTAVLRAMYSGRKRSRSELASITGLSKVSTSDVVADLMDEGYLTEGGYKSSARPGKPALMLEFNPSAASVIAVDLSETNEIVGALVDPEGLPCLCGKRGCLETLIAVPSLERQMSEHPEKRCEIITHAGHVLGNALAMVVAMTGVTDVVVSGPENLVDSSFRQATERCINDLVHSRFIDVVKVRDSRFQGDTALLGAVATVLRRRLNLL